MMRDRAGVVQLIGVEGECVAEIDSELGDNIGRGDVVWVIDKISRESFIGVIINLIRERGANYSISRKYYPEHIDIY